MSSASFLLTLSSPQYFFFFFTVCGICVTCRYILSNGRYSRRWFNQLCFCFIHSINTSSKHLFTFRIMKLICIFNTPLPDRVASDVRWCLQFIWSEFSLPVIRVSRLARRMCCSWSPTFTTSATVRSFRGYARIVKVIRRTNWLIVSFSKAYFFWAIHIHHHLLLLFLLSLMNCRNLTVRNARHKFDETRREFNSFVMLKKHATKRAIRFIIARPNSRIFIQSCGRALKCGHHYFPLYKHKAVSIPEWCWRNYTSRSR